MLNYIETLAIKAGARGIINSNGQILFAVVAPLGSKVYNEVQRTNPLNLFTTPQAAIAALPDGTVTDSFGCTLYLAPGAYAVTASSRVIIPTEQTGTRVYFDKGAVITAAVSLGSVGNALVELEGRNVELVGYPAISCSVTPMVGTALIIGGTLSSEGDGNNAYIENLVINGSEGTTDFAADVIVRGSTDVTLKDCYFYANAGTTTEILSFIQATDAVAYTRDGNRPRLINVNCIANNDTTNGVIPLSVSDASHPNGIIIGGSFLTDGSGKAIVITSEDWTLTGGGIAGSTAALTTGGVVDLVTATGINIGLFYVKDTNANTAPTLLDQTNI